MKNRTLKATLAGVFSALALVATAETHNISDFLISDPIKVRGQFADCNSNDKKGLLSNNINFNVIATEKIAEKNDTSETLTIINQSKTPELHILKTSLRSPHFANGTININSSSCCEVYIDGNLMTTQENKPANFAFKFEPQVDYEMIIKLLATDSTTNLSANFTTTNDSIQIFCSTGKKRRFKLSDTEFGNKIIGTSISANGKYLLTKYLNKISVSESEYKTTLTNLSTGKIITSALPNDAEWSYRGNFILFSTKSGKGYTINAIDPQTMSESVIATDFPVRSYIWNENSDAIIYTKEHKEEVSSSPLRRYDTPDDRIPGNKDRMEIIRYDLKTGLSESLVAGKISLSDVTPDCKRMIYTVIEETPTKRPFSSMTFIDVDLNTFATDTLVSSTGMLNNAVYSPSGKEVVFTGSPAAFDNLGNNSGNHPIPNDFDIQAYIMNLSTKDVEPITKDFNPSVEIIQWNKGDKKIYFLATEGFDKNIYSYDTANKIFTKLPSETDVTTSIAIGYENPSKIVYAGQSFDYASMMWMYDSKKRSNTLLADPLRDTLDKIEMGKTEKRNFINSGGDTIEGYLCYPPEFDASKKYPMIVYYYGGTLPTSKGMTNPYCGHLFASKGYVVYMLNPSGAIGYGQEFSARHVNAWGEYTADDIIEGVSRLIESCDFIDKEKIGCIGASYGGFMTQYLQTKTDLFAAAVSHAGISNVTSYWGEGYWGYSYNSVAAADSYPWNKPELFTRQGSLFNADKINTPLLLMHGSADTNVPVGESIQIFNALKILGKEVELVTVDGENHFIRDYTKRNLWHNTIMAWFEKWLRNDASWWNDIYKKQ